MTVKLSIIAVCVIWVTPTCVFAQFNDGAVTVDLRAVRANADCLSFSESPGGRSGSVFIRVANRCPDAYFQILYCVSDGIDGNRKLISGTPFDCKTVQETGFASRDSVTRGTTAPSQFTTMSYLSGYIKFIACKIPVKKAAFAGGDYKYDGIRFFWPSCGEIGGEAH